MLSDLSNHIATNAAAIIAVAALAFRDQLKLRLLLLVSIGITILMIVEAEGPPQWDNLFWNCVTWAINLWVTIQIVLDRTNIGLSEDEERLFSAFASLTPGEFRKLVRLATWHVADEPDILTREGIVPDRLFYVIEGGIEITKGNRTGLLGPQTFIGEIAFVRGTAASATVRVTPGSRYLAWRTMTLSAVFNRNQSFRMAVGRLLSVDMAAKVSRASTD